MFTDTKYTKWYFQITNRRKHDHVDGYTERHHIIPKSLGGADIGDNIVALSAREHFICHWLLTKMVTESDAKWKMMNALRMMRAENPSQERYSTGITARVYQRLKEEHAVMQSERMMGENNPFYNKTHTDEAKQRISEANTGDKNGAKTPAARKKISDAKRGKKREPFSQEWLDNLTATRQGELNGMFNKHHSEETRKRLSDLAKARSYSDETNEKRRQASGGRKEITNGIIYKKVKLEELESYLLDGWVIQGKPRKKKLK